MNILIWGTGEYSYLVSEHVQNVNHIMGTAFYNIVGYIDNDAQKNIYDGKTVYHPQDIGAEHEPIVIGIYEDRSVICQIEKEIGGIYYTFFDFVYRDIPIEKLEGKLFLDGVNLFSRKIKLQQTVERFVRKEISLEELKKKYSLVEVIAATFCIYARKIEQAVPIMDKLGLEQGTQIKEHVKNIGFYYSRYTNGGVERVMSNLMEMLVVKGYHVILFTDECQETGEYVLPVEAERVILNGKQQGFVYQWLVEFAEHIRKDKLDVLISHQSYWEGNYYLGCVAGLYGCRFITEIHNNFSAFALQNLTFFKSLYQNIERVVCLSETDKKFWELCGVDCSYIPNPTGIKKANRQGPQQHIGHNVLWIGRLEQKQKNVLDVLQVAHLVKKNIPDVKFHIVGNFSDRRIKERFIELRKELDLSDTIILCGYHTQVSQYYLENDLMMLTSDYEGFPMTVAEAMAYGCPIVSYELPYIEMFRFGKGVITVPARDTRQMAQEVEALLLDEKRRKHMSKEAGEVIEMFSDNNIISRWEVLFCGEGKSENCIRKWMELEKDYVNIIELLLDRVEKWVS